MSSLIFAQAKRIRKDALASKKLGVVTNLPEELQQKLYDDTVNRHRTEFKEILKIAKLLHEDYVEITQSVTNQWYFITIRPDWTKISFPEFFEKINKLTERKCFKQFTASFEQKGISEDTLGNGFHCHIVAYTSHRSKGECIRDISSTFNKWFNLGYITDNNIDVKPSRSPQQIIDKYLIQYESEDGHKIATKHWDELWRSKYNIKQFYENSIGINHCNKPMTVIDCPEGYKIDLS